MIWHYNHSQAYVNKVLGIANRVGPVGGDSRRDVERRLQVTRARPSPRADLDARAPAIPPPPFEVRPWALAPRPPITWYGRR